MLGLGTNDHYLSRGKCVCTGVCVCVGGRLININDCVCQSWLWLCFGIKQIQLFLFLFRLWKSCCPHSGQSLKVLNFSTSTTIPDKLTDLIYSERLEFGQKSPFFCQVQKFMTILLLKATVQFCAALSNINLSFPVSPVAVCFDLHQHSHPSQTTVTSFSTTVLKLPVYGDISFTRMLLTVWSIRNYM